MSQLEELLCTQLQVSHFTAGAPSLGTCRESSWGPEQQQQHRVLKYPPDLKVLTPG